MKRNLIIAGVVLVTGILVGLVANSQNSKSSAQTIELNENNTVVLRGPIHDGMAGTLIAKVQEASDRLPKNQSLYLVIDSPGGSIASGLDIISNLKTIPNLKTVTIFAASMGSGIVNGLPGERLGTENSISMFHRASGGVRGTFNEGELESQLNFWKGIVTKMEIQNASRMSISLDDYKRQVKDELWIHGLDNLSKKSLDTITSFKCTTSLITQVEPVQIMTMLGPITLNFSRCPLLTYPVSVEGGENALNIFNKTYNQISRQFGFGNRAL